MGSTISPFEVQTQLKRAKRSAPGSDHLTYAIWKWVDPQGAILAAIYNICRSAKRVPEDWKKSSVILIHKGGDEASMRNWRPICLQKTIYKLYSAFIARRIADCAISSGAFSPAQKGFLPFDGCSEQNFLLRSILTDSRRRKNDLMLTWLDLRDAFGSVPHELLLLMMGRIGLDDTTVDIVRDIYTGSTIAVRTEKASFTPDIPQARGVKQGCTLSPILFIALEGLLQHLSTSGLGYTIAELTPLPTQQPLPDTTGDNRPDLVVISPDNSSAILVDVTMPFEGSPSALEDAAAAKIAKYRPLCTQLSTHFASVIFLPFIIGSLGSWYPGNEDVLHHLRIGHRYTTLMRKLCVASAIGGTQNIWYTSMCTRRQ